MIVNKFAVQLAERLEKITTVAQATGISRTTLHSLYNRKTQRPCLEVLDKLCAYLGCTVGDLLEYRPEPEGGGITGVSSTEKLDD